MSGISVRPYIGASVRPYHGASVRQYVSTSVDAPLSSASPTDAPTYQNTDALSTDSPTHRRTFVGIGFGPIQAGLFLYEAARSGNFTRLVASEIIPEVVEAVNAAGGYSLNIAHSDHIESVTVSPVELYNPNAAIDRDLLITALAEASEVATALPSIGAYDSEDENAPARLIAAALVQRGTNAASLLIYAGENTVNAAEALAAAIRRHLPADAAGALLANVAIVNTVIGKMSGYAPDRQAKSSLAPIAPGLERAFLVEAFNEILISRPCFASSTAYERGIAIFSEQDNLLPYEEFKLYCHNGMHAMAAYLGKIAGCSSMAQLVYVPGLLPLIRTAVIEEAGAALVVGYRAQDDFFTTENIAERIDDLIERMVNPFLDDAIARVARDPARKLGWDDRLVGAMNLCLDLGIVPHRYALGAAAALADLVDPGASQSGAFPWGTLPTLWQRSEAEAGRAAYLEQLIAGAWVHLEAFRDAGSSTPVAPAAGKVVVQLVQEKMLIADEPLVADQEADGSPTGSAIPAGSATPARVAPDRTRHTPPHYYGEYASGEMYESESAA